MADDAGGKDHLSADVQSLTFSNDHSEAQVSLVLEEVRYVKIRAVTKAALDYANTAVTISLGLIGIMALWLGVMKVAEEAGLLRILTKLLTPFTRRLFPEVPPDHPAVGAMIMNVAANMLGLNNAATPLGLKAMEELNKLNPKLGTATNAMCTFLVINTAGLTLIPATAIAVRAAAGSTDPGIIIGTSIFGASCATIAGLIAVKLLQRLPWYKVEAESEASNG
ncbi:MAG: nucleoside recognition protein [Bacteroidota bacterium]|nr:nucleoside recognition protein [Bacteroidota bacterium]